MVSFPYYSHIFRDSYGSGMGIVWVEILMGIVWEAYHKRVPLLGVPEIALDSGVELKYIDGYSPKDQWCYCWLFRLLLLMAEIPNNHLACIKPCK